MILGSVDDVNTERVVGWVHSPLSKEVLKVEASIDNRVIGAAVANLFRPDLAEAKLGSGHCGFEIRFETAIDASFLPFVETRPAGGTVVLPRTSVAGFSDYFAALFKRYPRMGRFSSVFSGFWTDRSDAAALLKARCDIGRVTPQDAGILSRFISEGIAVIELDPTQEMAVRRPGAAQSPPAAPVRASSAAKPASVPANGGSVSAADLDLSATIARAFFDEKTLRLLREIIDDNPIAVAARIRKQNDKEYAQMSAWEDLASPAECLGLIVALGDDVSIEVLRGSHRFPEFTADGLSRWTFDGRPRVALANVAPNVYTDVFAVSRRSIAIVGPGLIHRIRASSASPAIQILGIPSYQGAARFRQQAPAGELSHRSGARIWLSEPA